MTILIFDVWEGPSLINQDRFSKEKICAPKWDQLRLVALPLVLICNLHEYHCRPNPLKQKPVAEAPAPREDPAFFPEMLGPNGTLRL